MDVFVFSAGEARSQDYGRESVDFGPLKSATEFLCEGGVSPRDNNFVFAYATASKEYLVYVGGLIGYGNQCVPVDHNRRPIRTSVAWFTDSESTARSLVIRAIEGYFHRASDTQSSENFADQVTSCLNWNCENELGYEVDDDALKDIAISQTQLENEPCLDRDCCNNQVTTATASKLASGLRDCQLPARVGPLVLVVDAVITQAAAGKVWRSLSVGVQPVTETDSSPGLLNFCDSRNYPTVTKALTKIQQASRKWLNGSNDF